MSRVRIQKFRTVDEDAENGARIVARFDCQVGAVRIYDCEMRSTPKGRVVVTPFGVSIAWSIMTEIRKAVRPKLD